jgi:hypothetical protein
MMKFRRIWLVDSSVAEQEQEPEPDPDPDPKHIKFSGSATLVYSRVLLIFFKAFLKKTE